MTQEPKNWRCFHCDEVFYTEDSARVHFGFDQCSEPACRIKSGAEHSLVRALRTAEAEIESLQMAIHNDSTEAAKAYYAQQSRHSTQLTAAEELGYERGMRDAKINEEIFRKSEKMYNLSQCFIHLTELYEKEYDSPERPLWLQGAFAIAKDTVETGKKP